MPSPDVDPPQNSRRAPARSLESRDGARRAIGDFGTRYRATRYLATHGLAIGLLALGCLFSPACGPGSPARRSALLITFDTTRADALGCYGNELEPSPNLDRLAAEGVLYERASTTIPLTLPAHSSMMTGLIPPRHSVRNNGWPLPESARTLAELARAGGIDTAAFVAAVVLDAHLGIAQGFDTYDAPRERVDAQASHYSERPAREVVDGAIGWLLARERERPFFLWVHVFEPHDPLQPEADFQRGPLADEPYLGEVATADRQIGRLLEMMRAEGLLDETVVLMTADHGEAFGEHGELSHGLYCYQPTIHVPLILRYPDGYGAGERRPAPASVVDVLPTLAQAMGLEVPARLDGQSLYRRRVEPERAVYCESYWGYLNYNWSPLCGWIDRSGKYLHSSRPEYYALDEDPLEQRDLFGEGSPPVQRARRALEAALDAPALTPTPSGGADPELLARIQSLGYAGVEDSGQELPGALETSELPSPRQGALEHEQVLVGQAQMNRGLYAEAEASFRTVLAVNPRNYMALDYLAFCLMRQDRRAQAVELLERLVAARPRNANGHYNLGLCLWEVGQRERAIESLRRALEQYPTHPAYAQDLIRFLRLERRDAEADQLEREARAQRH